MACRLFDAIPLPEPMLTYWIWPLGTNCGAIRIKVQNFSFMKMHLKMASAKWRPFSLVGDELTQTIPICRSASCWLLYKSEFVSLSCECIEANFYIYIEKFVNSCRYTYVTEYHSYKMKTSVKESKEAICSHKESHYPNHAGPFTFSFMKHLFEEYNIYVLFEIFATWYTHSASV